MERNANLRICYDRIVPDEYSPVGPVLHKMREAALLHATRKATAREAFHDLDPSAVIPPPHMAVIRSKAWPVGSHLKCRFLDGSPTQQARVMHKAKLWEQYANIHIDFVTTRDEQIRIAFQTGQGSWSAIGHDALISKYFPHDAPTMNYGWLADDTDDTEYERVVVHEFGHALGCIHEHQSPTEQLKWNVEAVYAQFSGPPNNWDKATIDANILQKYSPKGIDASIFDRHSIMLYQFPAELFLDHVGTPSNTRLSRKDKGFIAQMYPRH
jgi:hypothetical protein